MLSNQHTPLTLSGFPILPVGPGTNTTTLYRSHNAYNPDGTARDPRFFSPSYITETGQHRGGRFDLRRPLGTCNTGTTKAAALQERLAHSYTILSSDLENVRVSELRILRPLFLLDARRDGPGYTARDISDRHHKDTDYYLTQQVAQMAYEAGFDGIISKSSVCLDDNAYLFDEHGVHEEVLGIGDSWPGLEVYHELKQQNILLPALLDIPGTFGSALRETLEDN
jgi:hypothetical protein